MMKNLRYLVCLRCIVLTVISLFFIGNAWGDEVTLTAGTNGSTCTVNGQDGIKVGTSKAGGTMTITVPANSTKLTLHAAAWKGVSGLSLNITGATVSPTSISLTADDGISNNSPFTLSGNESDFLFEIALSGITNETVITLTSSTTKRFVVWGASAVVSSGGTPTVAIPTFSPAAGTYSSAQTVTISTETDGATIHYTTDGNDPTTSSATYKNAINISETTTLKAVAVKDGMNNSIVASATYTIIEPYANIAALTAATTSTTAATGFVTLSNAVVTYVNGSNAYIQDASGAVLLYLNNHGLTAGDVLNGTTATVTYALRNGNPQITAISGVAKVNGTAPNPTEIAAADWNKTFNSELSKYYKITDATITEDGGKYYISLGGQSVQLYGQGDAKNFTLSNLTSKYTVVGFPMLYVKDETTTLELQIFEVPEIVTYQITAVVNNSAYGTAEYDNGVITAKPAEGYRLADPAYTVTSGTATVTQDGNEFIVDAESNCTVQINFEAIPKHTATFYVNGEKLSDAVIVEDDAVIFPDATPEINGKIFIGWTTAEIDGETDEKPATLVTEATMGTTDVTYYAVYVVKEGGTGVAEVTDELTRATTGVTGTNYESWSGKTVASDAVYAGQSAGSNSSIQLRSNNNNSGVVSTTSGGKLKKVVVVWNSNTAEGRTLNVYGSNTAYSAATDLYNSSKQGTLIGTMASNGTISTTELSVTDDYKYVGFRSASGAMYLTSVSITWENDATATYSGYCTTVEEQAPAAPTFSPAAGTYDEAKTVEITAAEGATIYYTTDGSEPTAESNKYTEAITITRTTTLKAVAVKNDLTSEIAEATYTISVPAAPTFSPAGGAFDEATNVTITAAEGCQVKYTFEGTTETSAGNTVDVNVASTTTITAVAVKNGLESEVAEATYAIRQDAYLDVQNEDNESLTQYTLQCGGTVELPVMLNDMPAVEVEFENVPQALQVSYHHNSEMETEPGYMMIDAANAPAGEYQFTIKVPATDEFKLATMQFTVIVLKNPTSITISGFEAAKDLVDGTDGGTLTYELTPQAENMGAATWSSSNTDVATIDNDGKITLVGAGTVSFTVTYAGNGYYEACSQTTETMTVADTRPVPVVEPDPAPITEGYYMIKNNGNGKYVNVAGRKTVTFVDEAATAAAAGTVIRVKAAENGQVQVLRSQGVDVPGYAEKAMNYVPKMVKLVADKLHAVGSGALLGENGYDAIMAKFDESFDYHLYTEQAEGGVRIYGRTPSMQPVVDFYTENKANVDEKLPMLEQFVNDAIAKVLEKTGGRGASILTEFSLHEVWQNMGKTLTEPVDDASKLAFLQQVLANKENVWNFAYQTAMIYWTNVKNHPSFDEYKSKLGEYAQYIDKMEYIRPDVKYYLVQKDGKIDFNSQDNALITGNDASTMWTLEERTEFTVNFPEENVQNGKYYTTLYTDFAYTLPEGVKAYKVTEIQEGGDYGYAATEEIKAQSIAAQTPVLLVSESAGDQTLTLSETGTAVTGTNLLVGPDYLISTYKIKTSQVESLFDMAKSLLGEDGYNNYVAEYEHLMLRNAGTVNNKYFFGLSKDDCKVDEFVCLLGNTEEAGTVFANDWQTMGSNKAFLTSDIYTVIRLSLIGDVNRDGKVTLADVNALIEIVLGKVTEENNVSDGYNYDFDAAHVNADDDITIADVTALVNMILGK